MDLISDIRKRLTEYNRTAKKPYELSFAIGYAEYSPEYASLDEFLRDMDQKMYEDKEVFRKQCQ